MIALLFACAEPDVSSIEAALGVSAPVAYAGGLGLAAARGEGGACATAEPACTGFPCATTVTIAVGSDCPLPHAEEASGEISLAGAFEAGAAELAADFRAVDAGGRALKVAEVTAFTLTYDEGDPVLASWFRQDVNLSSGAEPTAGDPVGQEAWVTEIDDAGTPGDPTDDVYVTNGGAEAATDEGGLIASLVEATFSPACRRNPTSGGAALESGDGDGGGIDSFVFTEDCDGAMLHAAGVGTKTVGNSGKRVGIEMFD